MNFYYGGEAVVIKVLTNTKIHTIIIWYNSVKKLLKR